MPDLPKHFYATFGVQYAREPHPTLPAHIANPDKVIEIWAPSKEVARRLMTGLTLTGDQGAVKAAYAEVYDWPRALDMEAKMAEFYPGGVSMVIDCREL